MAVFFSDDDYRTYLDLLGEWSDRAGLDIWAYCLMANHVHVVAVPHSKDSLHLALREAHRRYSRQINFREGWRGYLWQGRFSGASGFRRDGGGGAAARCSPRRRQMNAIPA